MSSDNGHKSFSVEVYLEKIRLQLDEFFNQLKDSTETTRIYMFIKVKLKPLKNGKKYKHKYLNIKNDCITTGEPTEDIVNTLFQVLLSDHHGKM